VSHPKGRTRTEHVSEQVTEKIYGPNGDEVVVILYDGVLHNFCCSLNIIGVVESRRVRWVGHIACIEKMRNA
jgi:hypothetical protein